MLFSMFKFFKKGFFKYLSWSCHQTSHPILPPFWTLRNLMEFNLGGNCQKYKWFLRIRVYWPNSFTKVFSFQAFTQNTHSKKEEKIKRKGERYSEIIRNNCTQRSRRNIWQQTTVGGPYLINCQKGKHSSSRNQTH